MFRRATEGTCLAALVRMAIPVCREAQRRCPRTGRGRKPTIPDWAMAVLIMVVVAKKKKTKSAQYRFLKQHQRQLRRWLDVERFPARSTYFDRYLKAYRLFQEAIRVQGERAIAQGLVQAECVAADKSLLPAQGPPWHKRDRQRGVKRRGVDRDSTWSYSEHHGWVQGYGYEIVVSAAKSGAVWPLLASVDPAHWREHRTFSAKVLQLPKGTRYVLADAGYDSNFHGELIEGNLHGSPTGRHFLCPLQDHTATRKPAKKRWRETQERKAHRQQREKRRAYFTKPHARKLYTRRSITVEPFNEWFKSLFDLHHHVWHRGLNNNRTQILAAIFTYQMLLRYNYRHHRYHGQIQCLLDAL
jgi:hypothetical protein